MPKNNKVAFIYDFDETLSTTYMQDYILIPALGEKPEEFWPKANEWSRMHCADQITGTMYYIQYVAKEKGIKLTEKFLWDTAKSITYFAGVEEWFDRINEFGKSLGLNIEHYIISSGMEEIINGTTIRKYFKKVFGCSYIYDDETGVPIWPARIVNYSTKTQFIAKINKGLGKTEDRAVNEYMPDELRPIPYKQMIYFGDGMTDIPAMKIVKNKGGTAIAVYRPKSKHKDTAVQLLADDRVDFALPADYRENSELDHVVKTILTRMSSEHDLDILKLKEDNKKKQLTTRLRLKTRFALLASKLTKRKAKK